MLGLGLETVSLLGPGVLTRTLTLALTLTLTLTQVHVCGKQLLGLQTFYPNLIMQARPPPSLPPSPSSSFKTAGECVHAHVEGPGLVERSVYEITVTPMHMYTCRGSRAGAAAVRRLTRLSSMYTSTHRG